MSNDRQDGDELMGIIKNMILALPDDRFKELADLILELQELEQELEPNQ